MTAPRVPQALPSVEYLHECFSYAPETGVLTWRERPREHFTNGQGYGNFMARCYGRQAGSLMKNGYLQVGLVHSRHLVHRIVWALNYGWWPTYHIDHINGIRNDNRIYNLRDVTKPVNSRNMVKRNSNTSGVTGVAWHSQAGKW